MGAMTQISQQQVEDALSRIIDPDFGRDIVSLGFVKGIAVHGDTVACTIELTTPACPVKDQFKRQAEELIGAIHGVRKVNVTITARVAAGARSGMAPIPGIKQIIAVASGKGGVGKSTVAVNLAVALAQSGAKTGLLDADIYGPSVPRLLGLAGRRPQMKGEKLQPLGNHQVFAMSIGFLVPEDQAMIWRGPMVAGALTQLLTDVDWGELDYLIIDLPPGTGDAQLTLAQRVPVTGSLIVTTPQDIALLDAQKGIAMFHKVGVPLLGLVENMSVFVCPHCGGESHIFAQGGADRLAAEHDCEVLARIPLDASIRELSDAGTPVVAAMPDSAQAAAFRALAGEAARRISMNAAQPAPA